MCSDCLDVKSMYKVAEIPKDEKEKKREEGRKAGEKGDCVRRRK